MFDYEYLKVPPNFDTIVNIIEPTPSVNIASIVINSEYKCMAFRYTTGATSTAHTITFNENTECDILIVGGGGAGGCDNGAGGGGGGLIFVENFIGLGTYNIVVGRGGIGVNTEERGLRWWWWRWWWK